MADEQVQGEGLGEAAKPQLTEIEQRALDSGWRPKDEWEGDPELWRSAREFLDRGELFKKIDDQNRTIKDFKRTLDEFSKHHAKVRETEYKRAREELLAAKKEAINEGDAEAIVNIDEKLEAVREAQRSAPAVQVESQPELNPVFVAWRERNSWYESSEAMRAYADRVGNQLGATGGMSPTELLAEVERKVKKEFASRFENPRRNAPGAVETGGNKAGGKIDPFQLSEEERRVMQRFIRTVPGMTEDKYITDLKKIKGV